MAAAKHTPAPGPWSFSSTVLRDANGNSIASAGNNRAIVGEVLHASLRQAAASPEMLAALLAVQCLVSEALPKFDWGASALDANAIRLLNEVPAQVNAAIAKATGGAT